jgi:DNA-binding MarR family transcriptional regulator
MRALSDLQRRALRVMAALAADGIDVPTVRDIGPKTGQSSDGAACTLRSLVRRGLVDLGHHDGNRYGYKLTPAGRKREQRRRTVSLPVRTNETDEEYQRLLDTHMAQLSRAPRVTDQEAYEAQQEAWEEAWLARYAPNAVTPEEKAAIIGYYSCPG